MATPTSKSARSADLRAPRPADAEIAAVAADLIRRFPALAPTWSEQHEADPGIVLVQLIAFLADALGGREQPLPAAAAGQLAQTIERLAALSEPRQHDGPLTRTAFFAGQILTAGDLQQEQDYLRAKQRRHNRWLHGSGIVSGLGVSLPPAASDETPSVTISPGYAVAPDGEELLLPVPVSCPLPACGPFAYVTLQYAERGDGHVPDHSGGAQVTRIVEGNVVAVERSRPAQAVALARLLHANEGWVIDPSFHPPALPCPTQTR